MVESVPRGLERGSNVQQRYLPCPGGDDHFGRLREMGAAHSPMAASGSSFAGRPSGRAYTLRAKSFSLSWQCVPYGEAYGRDAQFAVCATTWWP